MQKLVLASNNQGKLLELGQLFAPLGFTLITQSDLGVGEAEEPHCTFVENALAKARFAAQHTHLPALADDAGLCIDAWGGLPGVDTAHFAASKGYPVAMGVERDRQNVDALLTQLAQENKLKPEERRAALVSTLVAVRHALDPEPLIAVGRVTGHLTLERWGSSGFGFDPVFYLSEYDKTFAQLPDAEKNRISHRGLASRAMRALMQERWV